MLALRKVSALILCAICCKNCFAQISTVDEEEAQIQRTIYQGTFSRNPVIRDHSFALMASQKDLDKYLEKTDIAKRISFGLTSNNTALGKFAFDLLDNSKLNDQEQFKLLIPAINSTSRTVRSEALKRLTDSRKKILPVLINRINENTDDPLTDEIRLIEYWGSDAKAAVSALVKKHNSLRNAAKEKMRKENKRKQTRHAMNGDNRPVLKLPDPDKDVRYQYLHIVYALAAIGEDAKAAMPIALEAANTRKGPNREAYNMAGTLCIERMLGQYKSPRSNSSNLRAAQLMGLRGGGAIGNFAGATSKAYKKPVRSIVEEYLDSSNVTTVNMQMVDDTVALIFQNYDLHTRKGELTIEEVRQIDPPILFSKVDRDGNEVISKDELKDYVYAQEKAFSRSGKTQRTYTRSNK